MCTNYTKFVKIAHYVCKTTYLCKKIHTLGVKIYTLYTRCVKKFHSVCEQILQCVCKHLHKMCIDLHSTYL